MIQLRAGYLIALAIGGLSFACLGDDVRYWSSVTTQAVELNENWKTASFAQIRSPELEFLQYERFSQKFLRSMGEKWTFGAHPAIEYKRSSGGDPWVNDIALRLRPSGSSSSAEVDLYTLERDWLGFAPSPSDSCCTCPHLRSFLASSNPRY